MSTRRAFKSRQMFYKEVYLSLSLSLTNITHTQTNHPQENIHAHRDVCQCKQPPPDCVRVRVCARMCVWVTSPELGRIWKPKQNHLVSQAPALPQRDTSMLGKAPHPPPGTRALYCMCPPCPVPLPPSQGFTRLAQGPWPVPSDTWASTLARGLLHITGKGCWMCACLSGFGRVLCVKRAEFRKTINKVVIHFFVIVYIGFVWGVVLDEST